MLQLPWLPAAKKQKHRLLLQRLPQHLHLLLLLKPLLALPLLPLAPRWMPLRPPPQPSALLLALPPRPLLMLPKTLLALPKMQPTLPKRPLTLLLPPLKSPERFVLQRKQKPPPGGFFYASRY